jgi:hypothetical protein
MIAPAAAIDLHSHSTASDGELPAEQVAERAAAAGVAVGSRSSWRIRPRETLACW